MEEDEQIGLSLEQEFQLKAFEAQTQNISLEQAKELLAQLHRQLLLKEVYFKHFIKQSFFTDFPPY